MNFDTPIELASLLKLVRSKQDRSKSYCVYGLGEPSEATLTTTCYLSAYADITDDDEEIYPEFVTSNGLELWYRDELFQDVVDNALHQRPDVSDTVILRALDHYNKVDCFLDLSTQGG